MASQDRFSEVGYHTDEDIADVSSIVGSGASTKEFKVHKTVFPSLTKPLYDIVCSNNESNSVRAVGSLDNADDAALLSIIKECHTGGKTELKTKDDAKRMVIACERFRCIDLKLRAEEVLAVDFLCSHNASELLVFAESHACAILKDHAMHAYAKRPEKVMEANKKDWFQVQKSPKLLLDLLRYTGVDLPNRVTYERYSNYSQEDKYLKAKHLTSSSLIRVLREAKLGVDGSREILLKRVEEHYKYCSDRKFRSKKRNKKNTFERPWEEHAKTSSSGFVLDWIAI